MFRKDVYQLANVQKENGYTAIANEILEALAKTPLNGTQRRILDVVFRYTYGFNRKEHNLSETFISNATTIDKRQVRRGLKELIDLNILRIAKEASFNSPRKFSFNKNYDKWQRTKKTSLDKIVPEDKKVHTPEDILDLSPEDILDLQERNIKDNIKDTTTIENLDEKISNHYFELTGRFANGCDYVAINKILSVYSDIDTIKNVMTKVTERKKKKDPNDKIMSFSFFAGAIEDEFKKIEAKKAGEKIGGTGPDTQKDYDYSKLMCKSATEYSDDDYDF